MKSIIKYLNEDDCIFKYDKKQEVIGKIFARDKKHFR
jgi:hypothetical protein